jgi:CRP-like cAMP-binding protein
MIAKPTSALAAPFRPLRALLESFGPIPASEWRFVEPFLVERSFARGNHLQRAGSAVTNLYFIVDGLVRNYLLDADGDERTTGFRFSGDLAGDYSAAVVTRGPGMRNIDALRTSRVIVFPSSLLLALYERHACWERVGRGILERDNLTKEEKESRFRRFTPDEHYRHLLVHKPHLASQVPLKHLASYLGIRPETLSRIRRRST